MFDIRQSQILIEAGFTHHGFTTRHGGKSKNSFESLNLAYDVGDDEQHVADNLRALQQHLRSKEPLLRVKQVHGNQVVEAGQLSPSASDDWTSRPAEEADGIVVPSSFSAYAAVQTADCAAVLLADPQNRHVAAIHAGWRGTQRGVIRTAVRAMNNLGASPRNLIAAIGPTICQKCYEVGEDVAQHFPESCDPIKKSPGKFLLDLPYAIEVSLIAAGLTSANIERLGRCTSCQPEDFFSYRGSAGQCGRMLGFISG